MFQYRIPGITTGIMPVNTVNYTLNALQYVKYRDICKILVRAKDAVEVSGLCTHKQQRCGPEESPPFIS